MAIINTFVYHGETWYSYMYAAEIRAQFQVALFTDVLPHSIHNENGLSYITRSWSRPFMHRKHEHVTQLLNSTVHICEYQFIVMTTLEISYLQRILNILANHCDEDATFILIVHVHRPTLDIVPLEKCLRKFSSLLSEGRIEVRIMVLAYHVKKFVELYMKMPLVVDIWIPVFPLDPPADGDNDEHHRYSKTSLTEHPS